MSTIKSSAGKVKCTYKGCTKTFENENEMKKHKRWEDSHDYCHRCDYDGKDYDDLLKHKVSAMAPYLIGHLRHLRHKHMKHIVCEFCGQEFGSLDGRKGHRQQMHQADQDICCQGKGQVWDRDQQRLVDAHCNGIFTRASGLVEHLEKGHCTFISRQQFIEARQQRYIIQQIMKNPEEFNNRLQGNNPKRKCLLTEDGQDDEQSTAGGVALDFGTLSVQDSPTNILALTPKAAAPNIMDEQAPIAHQMAIDKQKWQAIQSAYDYSRKQDEKTNLFTSRFWDRHSEHYNPDIFYNVEYDDYQCPFPGCDCQYKELSGLQDHLQRRHANPAKQCPRCLHSFETVTGLVQHVEASARGGKCLIAKTGEFEKWVTDVTGGLVEASRVEENKLWVRGTEEPAGIMATKYMAKGPVGGSTAVVRW